MGLKEKMAETWMGNMDSKEKREIMPILPIHLAGKKSVMIGATIAKRWGRSTRWLLSPLRRASISCRART